MRGVRHQGHVPPRAVHRRDRGVAVRRRRDRTSCASTASGAGGTRCCCSKTPTAEASPVFKSFVDASARRRRRTAKASRMPVDVYVPDDVWRQQMARVAGRYRRELRRGSRFVADSLDADRTRAAGFDAGAVGNPYIRPGASGRRLTDAVRSTRHSVFVRGQRRLRRTWLQKVPAAGSVLSAAGVRATPERAMGWAIVCARLAQQLVHEPASPRHSSAR